MGNAFAVYLYPLADVHQMRRCEKSGVNTGLAKHAVKIGAG